MFKKGIKHIFRGSVPVYQDAIVPALIFKDFPAVKRIANLGADYEYGRTAWKMFHTTLKKFRPAKSTKVGVPDTCKRREVWSQRLNTSRSILSSWASSVGERATQASVAGDAARRRYHGVDFPANVVVEIALEVPS